MVLQAIPLNLTPNEESNVTWMLLFAVTAVVLTVIETAPGWIVTLPEAADPHTAGDTILEQLPFIVRRSVAMPCVPGISIVGPPEGLPSPRTGPPTEPEDHTKEVAVTG